MIIFCHYREEVGLFHSSSVTGFQAIAYEYAAEMTYPLQEGISGGLVNWVSQVHAYHTLSDKRTQPSLIDEISVFKVLKDWYNLDRVEVDIPAILPLSQPVSILMVVVGAKFVTVNSHQVPIAWTIAGLVFIGAIITSEPVISEC